MIQRIQVLTFGAIIFAFSGEVMAQFGGVATPNDTLQSVRFQPDDEVTLSIYAPKASEVTVSGDFGFVPGGYKMSKDDAGIWSFSTDQLEPEVYTYEFRVDGVKTMDPKSTKIKEGANGLSNIFEMPGADYLAIKDVPHGKLEEVWFNAESLGNTVRMHVYTPPGYHQTDEELPVLYLQHGGGDNDASWSTVGRANFILDNLIAEGVAKPMVVVMPNGNPGEGFFTSISVDEDPYYDHLIEDIIPYVEAHFRIESTPVARAYSGLSMGGLQAYNVAFHLADEFNYILPLSTGFFPDQLEILEKKLQTDIAIEAINNLKLFCIAMGGEEDIAYENGENTKELLDKYGVNYQTSSYPAGHTFITWRRNLLEFAPMLFK
jgi:enterochelin esterase family protein